MGQSVISRHVDEPIPAWDCATTGHSFFTVGEAVRSACGKSRDDDEEDDIFQKLRVRRGFSGYTRGTWATDIDFWKMII